MTDALADKPWFPNFCRFLTVLAVMVIAELVVLINALSPGSMHEDVLAYVTIASFMVQWIAVMSAGLLCILRPTLSRLPVAAGLALAYSVVLSICALASWSAGWLDRSLGLGFTADIPSVSELVLGNLMVCALVAAAALRYFYVQHRWQRAVELRAEAQLRALQARIRPHFLFNSMNTIASLIRVRPESAERAVEDLSELFRAVLRSGSNDVSLTEELALCRRYLDLEQLRLDDRLRVVWDIDALPREAAVPSLLIQPLVENALYHGIHHLPEGGELAISGGVDGDRWWLRVENPVPARPPRNLDRGHGVALENLQARLEQRYGGRATMRSDRIDGQYRVELRVPLEKP